MSKKIIETDTGEILNELNEGDRLHIIRAESDKYLQEHITDFNKGKNFMKVFSYSGSILRSSLSYKEQAFIMELCEYMSYDDCFIHVTKDKKSPLATLKDIAQITGESYENTRKTMKNILKAGLISKAEIVQVKPGYEGKIKYVYIINPFIFFKGNNITKTVYNLFKDVGWEGKINELEKNENDVDGNPLPI